MGYIFILFTIITTVAGQILIKLGSSKTGAPSLSFDFLIKSMLNPYVFFGFFMMLLAGLSWVFAIKFFPLNFAYPFTALAIALVILVSSKMFDEPTGVVYWISVALIIAGVALLFFFKK